MHKVKKFFCVSTLFVTAVGCSDARCARRLSIGKPAFVQCYSGEKLIYEGISTGKIESSEGSDGYYFRDSSDQKLREVSGNCVVTYAAI